MSAVMTSAMIKIWAKKNPEKAKVLGLRLIQNQKSPEKLKALESLGAFEDRATVWAIAHPLKAKILILALVKNFL